MKDKREQGIISNSKVTNLENCGDEKDDDALFTEYKCWQ